MQPSKVQYAVYGQVQYFEPQTIPYCHWFGRIVLPTKGKLAISKTHFQSLDNVAKDFTVTLRVRIHLLKWYGNKRKVFGMFSEFKFSVNEEEKRNFKTH